MHVVVCILKGAFLFTATPRTRKKFLSRQSLIWLRGRTIGALRAERHTLTSAEWSSCSACHELLCSRAFLFIVLRSAQHPQIPPFFFLQIFQGIWPMPHSLLNHSALALFAQRTRIPTSARSIGFCAIWVRISSSSSSRSTQNRHVKPLSGLILGMRCFKYTDLPEVLRPSPNRHST